MGWTDMRGLFLIAGLLLALGTQTVAAQTAYWLERPPGSATAADMRWDAPATWTLWYWGGVPTEGWVAAQTCGDTCTMWVNVQGRWLGYQVQNPQASDQFRIEPGQAAFVRGSTIH